jgi:hypothetical protein
MKVNLAPFAYGRAGIGLGRIFISARACAPSGLKGEGSPDKFDDQQHKPGRDEGEEKLGHEGRTHEPVLCAYGRPSCFDGESWDIFSSRATVCSGTVLACSLVCSQSPLVGASRSRISLDAAAVFAGTLWRVGALGCRIGPRHQARPQEGVGAGEALALSFRRCQAESPCTPA